MTLRGDKRQGTLLAVLDETLTAMGARRLRAWLDQPLLDLAAIEARHDAVAALAADERLRAALRQRLEGLPDVGVPRTASSRATAGRASCRAWPGAWKDWRMVLPWRTAGRSRLIRWHRW